MREFAGWPIISHAKLAERPGGIVRGADSRQQSRKRFKPGPRLASVNLKVV